MRIKYYLKIIQHKDVRFFCYIVDSVVVAVGSRDSALYGMSENLQFYYIINEMEFCHRERVHLVIYSLMIGMHGA